MIENIIFDVDGTLWDCTATIAKAWNAVYENRGLPRRFTAAEVSSCMGLTSGEIVDKFFSDEEKAFGGEILGTCLKTQNFFLEREGGIIFPDVGETLKRLSCRYGLYIVSNCECGYIEAMFSFSGFAPFFRDFLCVGMTGKGKGENLILLKKKHSLENCVYVGDTHTDELACRKAEIPFIWASYGFGKAENPAAVLPRFSALENIIKFF